MAAETIKQLIDTLQSSVSRLEAENIAVKRLNGQLTNRLDSIAKMFNNVKPEEAHEAGVEFTQATVKARKKKGSGHRLSDETRQKIVAAYKSKDNVPVREIGKMFGASPFTVYNVLKKAGVKKRRD